MIFFTGKLILDMLDLEIEIYECSEIDKNAIDVSTFNHGSSITHKEDVISLANDDEYLESISPIHLLLGAPPCNELSKANWKRQGLSKY